MSDPMEEIRTSFFVECEELLESLFDAIQCMADEGADDDTINVAFRAVHSIKGGAGAFSLEELVAFAHEFETVMDRLRAHKLKLDDRLAELLLRSGDVLSDLVRASRDGTAIDPGQVAPVLAELAPFSGTDDGSSQKSAADVEVDFTPAAIELGDLTIAADPAGSEPDISDLPPLAPLEDIDCHQSPPFPDVSRNGGASERPAAARSGLVVTFRPAPELYDSGNEPLFLLRALEDVAACDISLRYDADATRGARLTWTIAIDCEDRVAVAANFEFVEGLCELRIERPGDNPPETGEDQETDAAPNFRPVSSLSEGPPDAELTAPSTPKERADAAPQSTAGPKAPEAASSTRPEPVAPEPTGKETKAAHVSATVRVDLERIDRLVNLVGELVINQSMLSQSVSESNLDHSSTVVQGLEELLQLTRDIQESVMMIRAQPVKSLFQRMARIVREASTAVDKKVRLVTDGDATEIDKTVIERLADPLTHMIRNAVDHGLEPTEGRATAGKPTEGVVRLTAAHKSGRVAIEIADDGRGLDRRRILDKAIEKGLVPEEAQLSDSEIDQLLFMPGFSTAEKVSNLSGRGVGMDVVKNAITALGGRIAISSTPGEGTTFSISLPLTLAVLDGMIVTVEGETIVVPLTAISETLTLNARDIRPISTDVQVVSVRESFVPLLDLGHVLGYREPLNSYDNAVALLITQEDGRRAALAVDTIEDQRQVVIKGLEENYGHIPGIAAATILGNGQIALILDPTDVVTSRGSSGPITLKEAS